MIATLTHYKNIKRNPVAYTLGWPSREPTRHGNLPLQHNTSRTFLKFVRPNEPLVHSQQWSKGQIWSG